MHNIYKYDWLVVGAGLFGATFANLMAEKGKKVLVMDKRYHIGGNCYLEVHDGIPLHKYGPHIFHTSSKAAWEYVNQFAKFNNFINAPKAMYVDEKNHEQKLFSLPFNMNTFHEMFGVITPNVAKSILKNEIDTYMDSLGREPENLEEQANCLVGPTIYNYLIKYYTERQWGRKCSELDKDIIKRLPVRLSYNNNYFNDKYQGVADYTTMIDKMLSKCDVALNEDYLVYKEEHDKLAEHVLYTGPIDRYFNYCLGPLEWRAVELRTWSTDPTDTQGVAVINNVGPDGDWTRTIEHKYFNCMDENTILTKNWYSKEYPVEWNPRDESLPDPSYPIYTSHTNYLFDQYKRLADKEEKVIFGGRLADFAYRDMDDTVLAAMELFSEVNE